MKTDAFNIYRLSTCSVAQAVLGAILQLCLEEAAGPGTWGKRKAVGSPEAPTIGFMALES